MGADIKEVVESLDLDLASNLFLPDFRDNFLPTLHDADILSVERERIIEDCETIPTGYLGAPIREILVPKPRMRLRIANLPMMRDWIIYNALTMRIAEAVEPNLIPEEEQILFSFRWDQNSPQEMFRSKHLPYRKYERRSLERLDTHSLVQVTDIADYFEHIDLSILREVLLRLRADQQTVDCLINSLLKNWTHRSRRGIPQGPWASSYLGNVYLDSLDKRMVRDGFVYLRYADEVRVFCNSTLEARLAMISLGEGCRELGLSMQSEKTALLPAAKARKAWEGLDKLLEGIQKEVADDLREYYVHFGPYGDESVEEVAPEEHEVMAQALRTLFNNVTSDVAPFDINRRAFRFVLNRLRNENLEQALDYCLRSLVDLPDMASSVAKYVGLFVDRPGVPERILGFLDSDENIYDWQAIQLLSALQDAEDPPSAVVRFAQQIALDRNAHDAMRCVCIDIVGKHGDEDGVRKLWEGFSSEHSEDVRIATILASRKLHVEERKRYLTSCRGISRVVDVAVRMARAPDSE